MSIFDIFKSAPSTPTATPAASTPGQIPANTQPAPTTPGATPNGVVPAVPTGNEPVKTPLDEFSTLWETPKDSQTPNAPFSFNIDPAKMQEAVGKIDFTKVISPDTLAKITAGGADAAPAFMDALNKTVQASFMQSSLAASKMVEAAVAKTRESMEANIPSLIKNQSLNESLRTSNPAFNHPAAAPVISALQTQLQIKNPTASVSELKTMAEDYFLSLGEAFNPKKPDAAETAASKETDWTKFLA